MKYLRQEGFTVRLECSPVDGYTYIEIRDQTRYSLVIIINDRCNIFSSNNMIGNM